MHTVPVYINDKHKIHHIHERGYVESPARISSIKRSLDTSKLFEYKKIAHFSKEHVTAVHNPGFYSFLEKTCATLPEDKSLYPYVFPIRNASRPPKESSVKAGYYCFDTFTPLNKNAFLSARRAVDATLSAAKAVEEGERLAYSLVRPPGHHAEKNVFGGFCYFNNNAIAAQYLSQHGPVAILDIDYHHGNGQQDIFYERSDVLTVSIHGHPRFAYPYFSGFKEEVGEGVGEGYNRNYPLPEIIQNSLYFETLERAIHKIKKYKPKYLVVALGLDTAKEDPTGTWTLMAEDFYHNGTLVGQIGCPVLVVQEGGYDTKVLGRNAKYFLKGLHASLFPKGTL